MLEVKDSMKKKRAEEKLAHDVRKLQQFGLKIRNPVPTGGMVLFIHGIRVRLKPDADAETSIPPSRKPN
jgi:hypothetical protein